MKSASFSGKRTLLLVGLTLFCTLAIIAVLVYREREAFLDFDWRIDWRWIGVAFVLLEIGLALMAYTWASQMRALGSKLGRGLHVRYYLAAHLARRLPGTLWYVAGRGYLYQQHGESVRFVTVASSVEMVLNMLAGGLTTLALSVWLLGQVSNLYLYAMILVVLAGLAALHPVTLRWLWRRLQLTEAPQLRYGQILIWLINYALVWLIGGGLLFAITRSITELSVDQLFYVLGCWCLIGVLSSVVFFLPTNFGFTEVGLSLLLSTVIPSSLAVFVAILTRVATLLFEVIGISLALIFFKLKEKAGLSSL